MATELASTAAHPAATPGRATVTVRHAVVETLPLLAGYVPFALVTGSVVAAHGSPLAGWSGSFLIFGGSAHVAAIRTLERSGAVAAIFTALLVNTRLVVYSASLARRWAGQPRWFRVVAAPLVIDPTWAIVEQRPSEGVDLADERRYFLAAAGTLIIGWSAAIGAGVLLGARLDHVDLRIVVPLCLLALIGASLRDRVTRRVIVVAALVALVTAHWPSGTGLLAAAVAGSAAGAVGAAGPRERRSA